jgi:ribosomal protein S18 acetylase RimI-like enzyme
MSGERGATTLSGGALQARLDSALAEVVALLATRGGGDAHREDGLLLVAARHPCPLIVNSAMRTGPVAAERVLDRAEEFFAARQRHYELWTRAGDDEDLQRCAESRGMTVSADLVGMIADSAPPVTRPPSGVLLGEVGDRHAVTGFVTAVGEGFRDEAPGAEGLVRAVFEDVRSLVAPDTRAFVATADGEPAAAALTIVRQGVAWIGWVATRPRFRGRGLATLVTGAATRAGFALGAGIASLEATTMGAPVYRRLGFHAVSRFRTYWPAGVRARAAEREPRA